MKSFGSLDFFNFWIFGFWIFGFWIFGFGGFGVLGCLDFCFTLVFPICRNSSKIGFGKKTAFASVFTVFSRGVRVVGGVSIHMYIYIYIYTEPTLGDLAPSELPCLVAIPSTEGFDMEIPICAPVTAAEGSTYPTCKDSGP